MGRDSIKEFSASGLAQRLARLKPHTVEDRNITFVGLDGLAMGVSSAAAGFLGVFVVRLGGDAFWVSLLSSLPALLTLVLTLPISQFVEKRPNVVSIFAWSRLVGRIAYIIIGVLPFFLPMQSSARAVVWVTAVAAIPMAMQQLGFSLTMNRAVSRERRAGMMSRRWISMGVSSIVVLLCIGFLLDAVAFPLNYQLMFLGSFVVAVICFLLISQVRALDEAPEYMRKGRMAPSGAFLSRLKQGLSEVVGERAFMMFVFGRNVYSLGLSLIAPLVPIYYIEHLHASDAWVSYFSTAATITSLLGYLLWVGLRPKRGNRFILLSSVLGRSIYPLLVALTGSSVGMLVVSAFNGVVASGENLMFFDAFMDTLPRGKEPRFLALNQTVANLIGFVAPPVGAWLLSVLGMHVTLIGGAAVAFAGYLVFLLGRVAQPAREVVATP